MFLQDNMIKYNSYLTQSPCPLGPPAGRAGRRAGILQRHVIYYAHTVTFQVFFNPSLSPQDS
jgi:hypothetical protein